MTVSSNATRLPFAFADSRSGGTKLGIYKSETGTGEKG